ncbi:hypothetical protein QK383_25490 [Pseudomonas aeruginosa]|uniref:hypothetical protein n=1 Tax=Pseudomonas TaxID=286 RepID=UPI00093C4687|nr:MULTISPECIES: hypothetical protein [Pseudomonas]EKW2616689.1 hypothetical protein [Pseudomonas aeruginosa]EKW2618781.1 hypothetical protein [Pseudomonas aeruginosa]EKX5126349.1 hypothetical protein [Pseudomonas aeruginosa]EMC2593447.1 hypothetical protein [Pseudomonas aeruginosa]KAB0704546.1 hypothetical protein F7O92_07520 [Pseudomonas aeruginosa]
MLMVMRLFGLLLAAFLVSGCSVRVPGAYVELDPFDDGYYGYDRGGPPHCPPGHAKKGWC